MRMHLESRDIARTGLMIALGVVLIVLGGYISTTTLFFLAASAFLAGVMEGNFSLGMGVLYLVGTALLGLFLTPQKLHIATFSAMGLYVLAAEWFEKRTSGEGRAFNPMVVWGCKFLLYHLLLALALVAFQALYGLEVVFMGGLPGKLSGEPGILVWLAAVLMAEVLWLVFDRAYLFFRRRYGHIFLYK